MATHAPSAPHRTFEKIPRATDDESETIDPDDIGTVSLSEIRRRLSR